MPTCAITGQPDDLAPNFDAVQHAVNHLRYDLDLAAELHRVVSSSVRTCPLIRQD